MLADSLLSYVCELQRKAQQASADRFSSVAAGTALALRWCCVSDQRTLHCAGMAAIHMCVSAAAVRTLHECTRARIDSPDGAGRTLLIHAVSRGHREVIAEVLACDADVHRADGAGNTALHIACQEVRCF
jgi:Ankyrin repeats (3 copies)